MNLPPARQKIVLAALLIAASTFVLYVGSLKNDFIGWDDDFYIVASPHITPLSGAVIWGMFSSFYFKSWTPLTLLVHAVDYSIWGLDPRGHHLTNMVIHSFNGVWVFLLTLSLVRKYRGRSAGPGTGDDTPGGDNALLAAGMASALMFAWHPLRVEAVACASSLKDLLSTFFVLPSILLYMAYTARRGTAGAWRPYAGSLVLFGLSLLSKNSLMTLPGILLLIDMMTGEPGGGWKRWWRLIADKIPFVVLGVGAAAVAYVAAEAAGNMAQMMRAQSEYSSGELGLYNLSFYFIKTLWPAVLAELYTYPLLGSFLLFASIAPAVTVLCAFLWWKGYRSCLYAWAAYVVALLPMAGFVASSIQVIANRYAYFAAIPFCLLFGAAILRVWSRGLPGGKPWMLPAVLVSASLALVALAARTAVHVKDWRDAETVWRRTIEVSPGHALAHNEMGLTLLEKKDFPGALASFKRALELAPRFSEVMCNMGGAYVSMNDTSNAEQILRRALSVSPDDYATLTNLGNVRMVEKRYAEAAEFYSASMARNPSSFVTAYDMGYSRMLTGSPGEALLYLRRATRLNPNYRDAYFLEGEILAKQKETADEALRAYVRAARLGHEQSQRILAERGLEW